MDITRSEEDLAAIDADLKKGAQEAGIDEKSGGEYLPGPSGNDAAMSNEQLAGAIALVIQMGTTFAAVRLGDHWKATEDEARMMASAYADAIDEYFPDVEVGAGVTAVMVTAMYAAPRMAMGTVEAKGAENGDKCE